MNKEIIGIDPGKKGGIISITEEKIKYWIIPKIGNEIDLRELDKIFKLFSKDCFMFIEKVHAIFGVSAKSTFEFGRICGLLEGMIISHGLAYQMVEPKIWQKEMFMGITPIYKPIKGKRKLLETKKMAELAYRRLFPDLDLYITDSGNKSKKVHDGLVDALLIGEFGRRKIK